jgi:hypothetical protein
MSEYFKRLGNIPVDKDLLIIYANGDDINIALAFINLMLIPSYPLAGLSLIVLITSSILCNRFYLISIYEMVFGMRCISSP